MMGQPTKDLPVTANRDVTDPAVQALIAAINAGDRAAFFAALTPGATFRTTAPTVTWPAGRTGRSSPSTAISTWSRRPTAGGPRSPPTETTRGAGSRRARR